MRLAKIFVGLLVILILAFFLSKNSNQYVTIWLFPGQELPDINLAHVLVSALALGIILGFAIGLIQILTQQRDARQQNRQLKKMRAELNNLRHSALDEDIFEGEGKRALPAQAATAPEEQQAQAGS